MPQKSRSGLDPRVKPVKPEDDPMVGDPETVLARKSLLPSFFSSRFSHAGAKREKSAPVVILGLDPRIHAPVYQRIGTRHLVSHMRKIGFNLCW